MSRVLDANGDAFLIQSPGALLDWTLDWSSVLMPGEALSSSLWFVDNDVITLSLPSHTPNAATVWITGGVDGGSYRLTNRTSSNAGRTDDRTIAVLIRQQ